MQSDTNTVFQNVGFGSSLSEFSPIGFSRTLNKAITIMPTDENVSQSEKEIKMTEMTRNTFLHLESIITATTSDNLCAFWKLRCLIKNINGVNIIVQIKTLDSYRDTGLRYALRPNFNFANQNVVLHLKHPQGLDSICHWSIKNEIVSNSI